MIVIVPSTIKITNPVFGSQNLVTTSNITAGTADPLFPATNLANPVTAAKWKATNNAAVTLDFAVAAMVDYVGIARHNLVGSQVQIYGDVGAGFVLIADMVPANNDVLMFRFTPAIYVSIRVKVTPVGAVIPEIAVIYVGLLVISERPIYVGHRPITMQPDTDIETGMSESGEFLGRIVTGETLETSVDLQHLTPAFVRNFLNPIFLAAKTAPLFFAWRPSTYPNEVGYVWLTENPKPQNQMSNGMMSVSMPMRGISA